MSFFILPKIINKIILEPIYDNNKQFDNKNKYKQFIYNVMVKPCEDKFNIFITNESLLLEWFKSLMYRLSGNTQFITSNDFYCFTKKQINDISN